ncbi:EAL domain-containing protein (putative c-di-GMP-specific phosphodiesterase class I) [Mycolicibacterium iranicum]|uniref:EAL domain-containing protein (Putative c-di-GMP-specific phosphodiesterase class I) n=1 Tax=Mycolicibacterium iranicum TaxID=912594 RepID=A0A839Q9J7_MYCIR|nr:EAL domain-containing protein (putative c-di-GMP-specific phosphodiesterase class I) [Mycolicibacterium iranicum]
MAGHGLVPAFQPVVSLPDEALVGYEALARWPSLDHPSPAVVFAHAAATGSSDLLDHACINLSAQAALDGRSAHGMLLLVNCEPTTVGIEIPSGTALSEAARTFKLTFELTERGLLRDPPALLRKVAALRALGVMIALDDIGAHPDSLALLDIIAPDVMKIDLGLVQRQPDQLQARTIAAVIAHHERTGSTILAEGIETDEHLEQALAYGATLGQGYRFGYPGALDTAPDGALLPDLALPANGDKAEMTPFELATADCDARTVRKRTLIELSRHIERLAVSAESPPIVLFTLQSSANFRGTTRDNYTRLAEKSPLVVAFAVNAREDLEPRLRWVDVDVADRMALEWTIVVIGPDTAAALIARELEPPGAEAYENDRRFEAVITFDRERVTQAARSLLNRCPAAGAISSAFSG